MSPCGRLSRPRSTISQYDFHSVARPSSPCQLVGPDKLSFEPNGSPVFTLIPLVACWRYEPGSTPGHLHSCAAYGSAFPFERQGRLLRSRSISGPFSRSLHSGLQPSCLRFAVAVTRPMQDKGSRLLARLCRGRHFRRQTSTRLQGATPTPPDVRVRIRRFAGLSTDGLCCVRARGSHSGRLPAGWPFEQRRPGFALSRRSEGQ
jgi:hypothetical protein